MRVFITGSNGFLAQKFCELVRDRHLPYQLMGVSKSSNRNIYLEEHEFLQLDVSFFEDLENSLTNFKPTHILHAVAMTSVEACEADRSQAYAINVLLTQQLSEYCKVHHIHLIFISTDFVFDGTNGPYTEDDPTGAVNYYGETKILAERAILDTHATAAILRTILVYGAIPDASRSNLVLWANSQLTHHKAIKAVVDQWRMPTWVDDLANACLLAMNIRANGIFHISGSEMMSIQETVYKVADTWKLDRDLISSTTALEMGQEQNRPRKTGFVLTKSKKVLNYQPTPFVESLAYICTQLKRYGR